MAVSFESSRFGTVEVDPSAVITFPRGLIGLGGNRYALVAHSGDGAIAWLHSIEDPELALPVADPWSFFADYEVELSDEDTARVGITEASEAQVLVVVRVGPSAADCYANLRAPILVAGGVGHQFINTLDVPLRAPLLPEPAGDAA